MQKPARSVATLLGFLIVLVLLAVGWSYLRGEVAQAPAYAKVYTNSQKGFTFHYPATWSVCSEVNDVEYVTVSDDCDAISAVASGQKLNFFMVRNIGDADIRDLQSGDLPLDGGWSSSKIGSEGAESMRAVYNQPKGITLVLLASDASMQKTLDSILKSTTFN